MDTVSYCFLLSSFVHCLVIIGLQLTRSQNLITVYACVSSSYSQQSLTTDADRMSPFVICVASCMRRHLVGLEHLAISFVLLASVGDF
jgi:hypothetical protein